MFTVASLYKSSTTLARHQFFCYWQSTIMKSMLVIPLMIVGCLSAHWDGQRGNSGWGDQGGRGLQGGWGGQGGRVQQGGRNLQGGWGNQGGRGYQGPGSQGGWGDQGGRGYQGPGSQGGWGDPRSQLGRSGRSPDGQQYGARFIDTPEQYGYEATIPGAQSRFVGYKTGRSAGQGEDGQQRGGAGTVGGWKSKGGRPEW